MMNLILLEKRATIALVIVLKNTIKKIDIENPLEIRGLSLYLKRSTKAKENIRSLFGGYSKIIIPINGNYLKEEYESLVREEFQSYIKKELGQKDYLSLLNEFKDSSLVGNSHSSGIRFTKKIKAMFNDELSEKIILEYSMIKNRVVLPNSNLVVSIDPLDFVNMGQGKNWHTCYAPKGDNYTGSFSVGLDEHSFLIYISSDPENPLAKTYRRTCTFSSDYRNIVMSTAYPYTSSSIDDLIVSELQKILSLKFEVDHNKSIISFRNTIGSQVFFDFRVPKFSDFKILSSNAHRDYQMGEVMFCLNCRSRVAKIHVPFCEHCISEGRERI